ncbi:hypothetical protein GCM10008986_00890 [Salinibacillus aidingensis]|uniref:YtkA-like domain-containing protein n=1 Tax=Salinibacillus aidingensis TaxID=237684 RepID=A0ABN1ANC5_9BACI
MKKIILFSSFFLLILFFTGCGTQEEKGTKSKTDDEQLQMIDVSLQLPSSIQVNEEVPLKAAVTLGEEKVEDATYVKFEIWKKGSAEENHEKIKAEHKGDGVYSITKTFSESGTYNIIAHTQARGMHNMPKEEFTVSE